MLTHTTSSLAKRFNACERHDLQRTDGSDWNRDTVRRFLEAMGVKRLPRAINAEGKSKGKIRYTEKAIRDTIPEFWEALLDDEKRRATAEIIASEHQAANDNTDTEPSSSAA